MPAKQAEKHAGQIGLTAAKIATNLLFSFEKKVSFSGLSALPLLAVSQLSLSIIVKLPLNSPLPLKSTKLNLTYLRDEWDEMSLYI